MQYSIFPKSDRKLSRLGFGAMGFAGWFGDQSVNQHIDALHAALDQGVNIIDTARAYEASEKIVGLGLKTWNGDRPFVATKIESLGKERRWGMPVPVEDTFPRGHIRASLETSLRELGMEQVDLVQLHTYWPTWGTDGYWMEELQALKAEGKTKYIGISVPDHRSDMVLPIVMSGLIDSVQTIINILDPLALDALVPFCQEYNVAVLARCILDEGGLTGFLTPDTSFPEGDYRHGYFEATLPLSVYLEKVESLKQFVPEYAASLAALAIKFVLYHPGVTTALTSMHIRQYAEMNIAAVDEPPLPEEIFHLLRTKHRFIKNYNNKNHWD